MRRALSEYVVTGIKTTLPFFMWLLQQPDFVAGRFHTTSLDEILKARGGDPFAATPREAEEVAAVAAALHAVLSSSSRVPAEAESARGGSVPPRQWKSRARSEGLR
jgi:acetyl/propionyl-CoA carboxylase alpha subunit